MPLKAAMLYWLVVIRQPFTRFGRWLCSHLRMVRTAILQLVRLTWKPEMPLLKMPCTVALPQDL